MSKLGHFVALIALILAAASYGTTYNNNNQGMNKNGRGSRSDKGTQYSTQQPGNTYVQPGPVFGDRPSPYPPYTHPTK